MHCGQEMKTKKLFDGSFIPPAKVFVGSELKNQNNFVKNYIKFNLHKVYNQKH